MYLNVLALFQLKKEKFFIPLIMYTLFSEQWKILTSRSESELKGSKAAGSFSGCGLAGS